MAAPAHERDLFGVCGSCFPNAKRETGTSEEKKMQHEYKLEMRGISKSFGGVHALSDVSLRVKPGEIHALLGENGAGKSTLMKILSGAYKRDSGEILIDGKPVKIDGPKDSKDNGIAVIYQELMLAPDLTVAENIFIDNMAAGSAFINWKKLRAETKKLLVSLGFDDINPNTTCSDLSVAYQQIVEICFSKRSGTQNFSAIRSSQEKCPSQMQLWANPI